MTPYNFSLTLYLKPIWNIAIILSANNPDVVDKLEGLVAQWSKVIEQVLAESEQVGCKLLLIELPINPVTQ